MVLDLNFNDMTSKMRLLDICMGQPFFVVMGFFFTVNSKEISTIQCR